VEPDVDFGAEDVTAPRIFGKSKKTRQGVGRDGRSQPLYGIAVVVIMRRLDHNEMKRLRPRYFHRHPPQCPAALEYVPSSDRRGRALLSVTLRLFNAICKRWLVRLKTVA
jgi:hypothetical protein